MKLARYVLLMCMCAGLTAGFASICVAAGPIEVEDLLIESLEASGEPSGSTHAARKAAMLARARNSKAAVLKKDKDPKEKVVVVDCDKRDSLQDAIDNNADPVVIEVHGICDENVLVRRRDGLTIRGTDPEHPEFDGIRGVVADPQPIGALEVRYSDQIRVENLSMSDSPRGGLRTVQSSIIVENCWIIGNSSSGIIIRESSNFQGFGLTISENGTDDPDPALARGNGLFVTGSSVGACTGCEFTDNVRWAAVSTSGSLVTLLQSVVRGPRGIASSIQSYIDIDCYTNKDAYPDYSDCSLDVDNWAAAGSWWSEAVMYVAGSFVGRLYAENGSTVWLYGSQHQTVESNPWNQIHDFSKLKVESFWEETDEGGILHEGVLRGSTRMRGFSRALMLPNTELDGEVVCDDAADAWADGGVSYTPGSGFCGCEHATNGPDSCP